MGPEVGVLDINLWGLVHRVSVATPWVANTYPLSAAPMGHGSQLRLGDPWGMGIYTHRFMSKTPTLGPMGVPIECSWLPIFGPDLWVS